MWYITSSKTHAYQYQLALSLRHNRLCSCCDRKQSHASTTKPISKCRLFAPFRFQAFIIDAFGSFRTRWSHVIKAWSINLRFFQPNISLGLHSKRNSSPQNASMAKRRRMKHVLWIVSLIFRSMLSRVNEPLVYVEEFHHSSLVGLRQCM